MRFWLLRPLLVGSFSPALGEWLCHHYDPARGEDDAWCASAAVDERGFEYELNLQGSWSSCGECRCCKRVAKAAKPAPPPLASRIQFGADTFSETDCWDIELFPFEDCCHPLYDIRNLWSILDGVEEPVGHENCWHKNYSFASCCTLNANIRKSPLYAHAFWTLAHKGRLLTVVQGSALSRFQHDTDFMPERGRIPHFGRNINAGGDGILWRAGHHGALLMQMLEFDFPIVGCHGDGAPPHGDGACAGARRRFLEVAAGTGAPSIVALSRGFEVSSLDLTEESAWQRQISVRASFGVGAPELKRVEVWPPLDLLNPSTWPSRPFDVIFMSQVDGSNKTPALCSGFRLLVRRLLHPSGVGIYVKDSRDGLLRSSRDYACFKSDDELSSRVHFRADGGTWRSEPLDGLTDFGSLELDPWKVLKPGFELRKRRGRSP